MNDFFWNSLDKGARRLFSAIKTLENEVAKERVSFRTQIQKLRVENASLALKLRQLTEVPSRKPGDASSALRRRSTPPPRSLRSRRSLSRKGRSRSPSLSGRYKAAPSLSPGACFIPSRRSISCTARSTLLAREQSPTFLFLEISRFSRQSLPSSLSAYFSGTHATEGSS